MSGADGVEWVIGEVAERGAVEELVRGAHVVVHAASYVHHRPRGAADLRELRRTNVEGTARVADAAARQPGSALVFVSSTAVYGASPGEWDERTPCAPRTEYGESKLEGERIVLGAHPRGGVVRPSAVVGQGAPGNLVALDALVRRGIVPVVNGGEARKSLTHVSTVVASILALASRLAAVSRDQRESRTFVVTDDEPCTVREIAAWRASALGRSPHFVSIPRELLGAPLAALGRARIDGVMLRSAAALLVALADDAVARNDAMREVLGVVPSPTARAFLREGAR